MFWELLISEVAAYLAGVIVVVAAILVTLTIRKGGKFLSEWLGIDIAEWEVYHTARALLRAKGDHQELVLEILQIVSYRLEQRGIKISQEELMDIIENTLEDLKKQES